MSFRVVEQFVESKSDNRDCEDMIVVTNDFVAVIDGASDATGAQFAGKAGGRFAAEVVAATIEGLDADATARSFADALAGALGAAVSGTVGELDGDTRWPVAVVACASARRREVWRVGDCNLVINGESFPGTIRVNDATHGFRSAVNAALLGKGMPLADVLANDPGARAARALIDIQQHLANTTGPWGYGCINGQRVPDEFIEVLPLPAGDTEVIITSDGFPIVLPTLAATEAALKGMLERDPAAVGELMTIGKSMKPGANAPDDRAYVRFVIA